MSREATLLNEIWGIIATHIPKSEKIEVANQLVELFDEYSMADGFEHETEFEGPLKAAVVAYFDLDSDKDNEDKEYDAD